MIASVAPFCPASASISRARRCSRLRRHFREGAAIRTPFIEHLDVKAETRPGPPWCVTKGTEAACGRSTAHNRTRKTQRRGHQAFRGPKNGRRYDLAGVLQAGHAACILVERVEKATDN